MDNFGLGLESSDDEAPEEVTFEDSRAQALQSVKQALERARREKEQLKEKRRRRQKLFQQQKKRKRLSAKVLEEVASSEKQKRVEDEAEEKKGDKRRKRKQRRRKLSHARNLKGNYTVTTGKQQTLASFQQKAAEDFLKSRLYGPRSGRSTNNELLSLQNKKGMNRSAAVQFVRKDWGREEKAKAEKLKRRWIHKQQIPSS